jgi:DNA-binding NarL/FixJ family response regulator
MSRDLSSHVNPSDPPVPIRVLVVDDHEMVREGLRALLSRFPIIEVVGEAADVEGAVRAAKTSKPDVVLLDIRLGGESGLDVCRRFQDEPDRPRFLVLTGFSEESWMYEAAALGADGYLFKTVDGTSLVQAIQSVTRGTPVLHPVVSQVVARSDSGTLLSAGERIGLLSVQERRILKQVAEGKTNGEVAAELGLSEKTVKNYLSNTLSKLGLKRRTQAVAYFARHPFA